MAIRACITRSAACQSIRQASCKSRWVSYCHLRQTFARVGVCMASPMLILASQCKHLQIRVVAVKLDVGVDGAASLLVATGSPRPGFERFSVPATGQACIEAVLGSSKVWGRPVPAATPQPV